MSPSPHLPFGNRWEIPVTVEVSRAADEGINLILRVVDASTAEVIGAAPKAASLSGPTCAPDPSGRWARAVTVDA